MISLLRRTTFAAIAIFATAAVPARAQAISEPFAVHFLETIANGAFQRTGYNIVASASHTTGTYTQGSASNHLDAQFTFIAARQSTVPPVESARFTFIGQGTYDFSQSGQVQTIQVSCNLVSLSGSRTLSFTYSSINQLDQKVLDETFDVTNVGGGTNRHTVAKHATLVSTGSSELHTMDGTVTVDGITSTVHWTNTSTIITPQATTVHTFATSSDTVGNSTQVDADYTLTIDALEQATVQFATFSITKPDGVYALNSSLPSSFTTTKMDADTYGVNYNIRLQRPSPMRSVELSMGGTCALIRPTGGAFLPDEGWSWGTFAKYTVAGAVGGAGSGAVASLLTDCAAPIAVGPAAFIGGVAGGVGGALVYTTEQAWDWMFGSDNNLLPPPNNMRCSASTFFEGHADFVSMNYDVSGGASQSGP